MEILSTERLTLSKITLNDAGFLHELMNDKDWIQNIGDREGIEGIEIGYGLLPAYRGKGYAFEATEAIYNYAKNELKLEKIVAIVAPHNDKSIFLLERLGLRFEKMVTLPGEDRNPILHLNLLCNFRIILSIYNI